VKAFVARRPLAWRHRGFRQLTRAWVFTNIADSALYLSLAVWVKDLTGSNSAAALVMVALGLPALASPLLGHLADRVSRRRLLAAANVVVALAVLSLLAVEDASRVWLVYAVTLVYAGAAYLTAAAQSGLVRDLLDDEELPGANGMLSTIDQALRLVSPLAGAAVYAAFGPHVVAVATAVCFAAAAVQLWRVQVAESGPSADEERGSYLAEVSAGIRHLARTAALSAPTVAIAVAFGASGMINAAIFPVMEQGLGVPAAALGALVSLQGIGAVAGGTSAAWAIKRLGERRVVLVGLLLLAAGMAPLATPSLPAVIAGLAAGGAGVTWVVVAYVTLRQRLTPPHLQGRTAAASHLVFNLPQTAATAVAASVLAVVDYRLLVAATVLLVLVGAAVAGLRGRGVEISGGPEAPAAGADSAPSGGADDKSGPGSALDGPDGRAEAGPGSEPAAGPVTVPEVTDAKPVGPGV